jgi:hypothetical protein
MRKSRICLPVPSALKTSVKVTSSATCYVAISSTQRASTLGSVSDRALAHYGMLQTPFKAPRTPPRLTFPCGVREKSDRLRSPDHLGSHAQAASRKDSHSDPFGSRADSWFVNPVTTCDPQGFTRIKLKSRWYNHIQPTWLKSPTCN